MPEEVEKQLKPNGTDTTTTATTKNNAEASEDDPCIDDSKNPRKKRWEKCRDGICEKTELTHKNFFYVAGIAAGCLLLLIVVIALAATWPHLSHSYKYPICKESSCIRAASQIRESMNSFSSPCSDLWNWTCGGWLTKYPLPKDRSIWNQKEQLMKKEYERIRDQIATLKPPLHTSSVEWKLKYLYEACMDVDNINNDKEKPLMNIISELDEVIDNMRVRDKHGTGYVKGKYFKKVLMDALDYLTEDEMIELLKEYEYDEESYIDYENFLISILSEKFPAKP